VKLRFLLVVLALGALVGCDHSSKQWAESSLRAGGRIDLVDGVLGLRYTQNHDMAFSLMRDVPASMRTPIIVVLATLTTAAVVVLLVRRRKNLPEVAAYTFILGGAIGNLADRFLRGYVVDFIHLQYWPIFNFADIWVGIGIGLLLLQHLRATRDPPPQPVSH
jgi:signal peptidase II